MTDHPALIRYIGFIGSIALAIDAYLSGARTKLPAIATPESIATGPNGVLIMTLWIGGTAALAGAWYFGRNFAGRDFFTKRWVVLTAALWTLPMLVIPPLGSRDVYAYSCQGALYAAGHNPYHEGISALPCQWIDSVSIIWRSSPAPYGPLFLMIAALAAKLGSLTAAIIAFRLLSVVGVAIIGFSIAPLARRLGLSAERALWLVLASPLVVKDLIGGAHNDALTIALLVAALAVIVARYDRLSGLIIGGALAGLSIAIKPTMLVALPFIVLYVSGGADSPTAHSPTADSPTAASPTGDPNPIRGPFGFPRVGPLVKRGGTVLASAFVALCIPTFISGLGFGWISALTHAGGGIAWTSASSATGRTLDFLLQLVGVHVYTVSVARSIGVGLMLVALVLIFWRARYGERFYAAGLALLSVSFFAPFAEPWYLLWPLVMFAITRVRARWLMISIVAACFTAMPDGVNLNNLIGFPGSIFMTGVAVWGLVVGIAWLRGAQPSEIDRDPAPETAGSLVS